MRWLVLAAFLALTGAAHAAEGVDVAIVFVVDVSPSMDNNEVAIARQAHATALASKEVLDAIADGMIGRIAVSYVEFDDHAYERIGWTQITGSDSAHRFGDAILAVTKTRPGSSTAVGEGLLLADGLLERLPFRATRLVVDVVGDGVNVVGAGVELGRQAILSRGATINGLPLMIAPDSADLAEWYGSAVAGGPGHFLIPINRIEDMPAALRQKIVMELF